MLYTLRFFSSKCSLFHNANLFGYCIIHILYTECAEIKKKFRRQRVNLVKSFKFTLKYTIISLLHASVFNDHHQGALSIPDYSYIYVKTLGKITSLCISGDVAACRRAACVLCAVHTHDT